MTVIWIGCLTGGSTGLAEPYPSRMSVVPQGRRGALMVQLVALRLPPSGAHPSGPGRQRCSGAYGRVLTCTTPSGARSGTQGDGT